jgi:hypothetical protein
MEEGRKIMKIPNSRRTDIRHSYPNHKKSNMADFQMELVFFGV